MGGACSKIWNCLCPCLRKDLSDEDQQTENDEEKKPRNQLEVRIKKIEEKLRVARIQKEEAIQEKLKMTYFLDSRLIEKDDDLTKLKEHIRKCEEEIISLKYSLHDTQFKESKLRDEL